MRWIHGLVAVTALMLAACGEEDFGPEVGEIQQTIPNCEWSSSKSTRFYCGGQYMAFVYTWTPSWHACGYNYDVALFESDPNDQFPPAGWAELDNAAFTMATMADVDAWLVPRTVCEAQELPGPRTELGGG